MDAIHSMMAVCISVFEYVTYSHMNPFKALRMRA
jgi:hypothetical protein